ncbi:acyl carrier protein [Sphingobium rhizovicinum]|uniref:Acyl carrier protein n=1 Tax=Sphingobium rhizovicinum TaxID=432308 RepID=A0ABV7NDR0_9SPHN
MSTLEKIKQIVGKQLGRDPEEFDESTDLAEAGYESLDVIETIFALEEEFDLSINFQANDSEAAGMKTVGDIVRMVEAELAKKGAH